MKKETLELANKLTSKIENLKKKLEHFDTMPLKLMLYNDRNLDTPIVWSSSIDDKLCSDFVHAVRNTIESDLKLAEKQFEELE